MSDAFHKNYRNKGKDSYDPLFEKIATKIAEELNDHESKELEDLHYLSDIRFGANFSDSKFMQYIKVEEDQFKLVGKPSDQDPMFRRVKAIRVRDQLLLTAYKITMLLFLQK